MTSRGGKDMFRLPQLSTLTFLLLCLLPPVEVLADPQHDLRLISARDHIEGAFTTNRMLYADKERIYLASAFRDVDAGLGGELFVLARDRAADFPVLQVIETSAPWLTGVTGDRKHLYVTSFDGYLRVYRKTDPLELVRTERIATYQIGGAEVVGNRLYVVRGTYHFDVDRKHVFLSQLTPGDAVIEFPTKTLSPSLTYGEAFVPDMAVIYDRRTSQPLMSLPNPLDVFGNVAAVASVHVDGKYLFRTVPGCCGTSVDIYDARTFELVEHMHLRAANVVTRQGQSLLVGDEFGIVHLFDLGVTPPQLVESIDLRQATGHFGRAAIEIRALWSDRHDDLVFAASSWGSPSVRGPDLPSFFVFELSRKQQNQ